MTSIKVGDVVHSRVVLIGETRLLTMEDWDRSGPELQEVWEAMARPEEPVLSELEASPMTAEEMLDKKTAEMEWVPPVSQETPGDVGCGC